MTKQHHIQRVQDVREVWLQALWSQQLFRKKQLKTICGQRVDVEFAGWWNRGPGPDFQEARLKIEGIAYIGSVEVHRKSSDWYHHAHQTNPMYNSVVLHLVLDQDSTKGIKRQDATEVPEIELRPMLTPQMLAMMGNPEELLKNYDQLPGECGMQVAKWGASALRRLLSQAAETRMLNKMNRILERWDQNEPEEILYQAIFTALGQKAYALAFEELAQTFRAEEIFSLLRQTQRVSRPIILSRWFGAMGALKSEVIPEDPTLRREHQQLTQEWQSYSKPIVLAHKFNRSSRPLNSPERRLVGLFHHLHHFSNVGLVKGWLGLLKAIEPLLTSPQFSKLAIAKIAESFVTPAWEPWTHYSSFKSNRLPQSTQLIGTNRITIVLANAVLPFFLAYSRHHGWRDLERLLFHLFLALPPEASNQITRFMEKRFLPLPAKSLAPRTLYIEQGLIQLNQDFCKTFEKGCCECHMITMLKNYHYTHQVTK